MLTKKTSKNQLTLPKEIVKEFPDVVYFDAKVKGRAIVLTPVKITPIETSIDLIREKMARLGIAETGVRDAVKWARKRRH
jgi:hypothetical protein